MRDEGLQYMTRRDQLDRNIKAMQAYKKLKRRSVVSELWLNRIRTKIKKTGDGESENLISSLVIREAVWSSEYLLAGKGETK